MVIAFLTDQNCPDSIGAYLTNLGHDVVRVRDIMPADSADPVVAEAAIQAGRVLVGWDKDFNHQRFLSPRFKGLSRIGFSCSEVDGVMRLEQLMDIVEFEYARATEDRPMVIKIGRDKFTSNR